MTVSSASSVVPSRAPCAWRACGAQPPTADLDVLAVPLDAPLELRPVVVPKPWGREIWFTGMERRGESRVGTGGAELPLSAYLARAPVDLCGGRTPVLLKILEPRCEPFAGDLYYEVHAEKHEVYVVDRVDAQAHPTGRGAVRLGVNQRLRRRLGDEAFRRCFLRAIERFERIRLAVDAGADGAVEDAAREAVLAYTGTASVAPGDVVEVPAGYPHALQHGVRVVEFQTPAYERSIVYATQRVVTQPRWDSADAVRRMRLEPLTGPRPDFHKGGFERLAEPPGFAVYRLRLSGGSDWRCTQTPAYAVCLLSRGAARIGTGARALELLAGQAAFVPGSAGQLRVSTETGSELLVAFPER